MDVLLLFITQKVIMELNNLYERALAFEFLSAEEGMYLFNNAPCGYHTVNKDLIIVEMNDTELHWLGYTRAEVIGKMPVYNIYSPESVKLLERIRADLSKHKTSSLQDFEIRCKRKDGTAVF